MKKLLAVVAVVATLVGSVFASESIFGLTVGYNGYTQKLSSDGDYLKYKYSGIGFGFQTASMYTDLLGIEADMSLNLTSKGTISASIDGESGSKSVELDNVGTMIDASVGLAIRPYNENNIGLFIIPNVGYYIWLPSSKNRSSSSSHTYMNIGFGVDVMGMFCLNDNIGLSVGCDYDYYFIDLFDDNDYPDGVTLKYSMFKPKIGLNVKF